MSNKKEPSQQLQNAELEKMLEEKSAALELMKRDAAIEAALEKVRARSMTMQQSDELSDVLSVLFEQFDVLGISPVYTFLSLIDLDKNLVTYRQTGKSGTKVLSEIQFPLDSMAEWEDLVGRMKEGNADSVNCAHYPVETFPKVWEVFGEIFDALPEGSKISQEDFPNGIFTVAGYCKYGYIGYDHDRAWTEEDKSIIQRFATEFGRLYRRFLDLQKAEAQVKEAQIEAALERIRSKASGIRKSNELLDIIHTVFEEWKKLGLEFYECNINLLDRSNKEWTNWGTGIRDTKLPKSYKLPWFDHPFLSQIYDDTLAGFPCRTIILEGLEYDRFIEHLFANTDFKNSPKEYQDALRSIKKIYCTHAYMQYGSIDAVGAEQLPNEAGEILKRFTKVFEQAYTRYLDIVYAEAQAREAQIEAALERVRARTMAMQHSEELAEVATILFQQVKALGVPQWTCGFSIFEIDDKEFTWYPGSADGDILPPVKIPLTEHPVFISFNDSRKRGDELFIYEKEGEFQAGHYRYMQSLPGIGGLLQKMLDAGLTFPTFQIDHVANFSHGNLVFITYEHFPEMHDVFKRFAKVFEQTYTRFLDLQNAEAQAREAKIEAALEKVRSRTMAMQRSDELGDAAMLLFQQIQGLGAPPWSCGFNIYDDDRKATTAWMASELVKGINLSFKAPTDEHVFKHIYEAAQREEALYIHEIKSGEIEAHYGYMFTLPVAGDRLKAFVASGGVLPTIQILHVAFFSQGYLLFITQEPVQELWDVFKRFAKVFEQTYTRFLDLKNAEEQARESQIQLALERVRARTMAMQHSNELQETALLLLQQVLALGVSQLGCGFNIWDDDRKAFTSWMGGGLGENTLVPPFKVSTSEDVFLLIYEAAQRGESLFVREQAGEELEAHYRYMFSMPVWKEIMGDFTPPTFQVVHCAFFSQGFLMFVSTEPIPEAHDIFIRFAKVFEQTYTRFLDLQKAEAQARESQIQLALERVRARTMAMQRGDELGDAASLLFKQIADLGTRQWSSGFDIWNANEISAVAWMSNPDGSMGKPFNVPYTEDPFFKKIYQARQTGADFFVMESSGKELEETYQYLFNLPEAKKYFDDALNSGFGVPKFQITHCAFFSHGYLMFITFEAAPEMWDIFKRFAKVFEQTYMRFLDLQTAEAQARESQIQLALERVRARTMAMQKSDELREVIQLIHQQLIQLNFEITNSGFGIDYKDTDDFNLWMADAYTEFPMKVHIPYIDHPQMNCFKEAKEKGLDFLTNTLTFEAKNKWFEYCFENLPWISEEAKSLTFNWAGIATSAALMKNVFLYLLNYDGIPFSDSDNEILKRFGKVFEQTYTRFLDLQKAEAQVRESQIQLALERVRARTMAMQRSEELSETAVEMFNQVKALDVHTFSCGFHIFEKEEMAVTEWMSDPGGSYGVN